MLTAVAIGLVVFAGVTGLMRWSVRRAGAAPARTLVAPQVGGVPMAIGVFAGFVGVAVVLGAARELAWIGAGTTLIFVVSYLDDLGGVGAGGRLLVHFVAALILLSGGFWLTILEMPGVAWALPAYASVVVSLLFVAWMVNLYNFMDGIDGLAGGMGVIGFMWFAILGGIGGDVTFTAVCLVVCAAAAGFLPFNIAPARMLMGDTGSTVLGFLAAALCLWASRDGLFPLWAGAVVLSPLIVDATVTLLRRMWRGERIWEAHQEHYYQRLLAFGWTVKRVTHVAYGLMFFCGLAVALVLRGAVEVQWMLLGVVTVMYALLIDHVRRRERASSGTAPTPLSDRASTEKARG